MSFEEFKSIADVQKKYNIIYQEEDFIEPITLAPSKTFLEEYEFSIKYLHVLASEASRCENIIHPILRDVYKNHVDKLSLWSHKSIKFDDVLSGIPDYMISARSKLGKTVLERPLLAVVEAKRSDFTQGWGQCLAELVAAQKINADSELPVYGIVTDGPFLQFGKLEGSYFTFHKSAFTSSDLDRLFGCINFILQNVAKMVQ